MLQVVVTLVLLYFQMGDAALLGACVFIFVIPIQLFVGSAMSKYEEQTLVCIPDFEVGSNSVDAEIIYHHVDYYFGSFCSLQYVLSKMRRSHTAM